MITRTMSSINHSDERASKRMRLKDGVDAGVSRRPSPSLAEPKAKPTNYLLACYMAHEFLTRGTLLGRRFPQEEAKSTPIDEKPHATRQAYADLSCLLKDDGVHLPGIVNPTQLARLARWRRWASSIGYVLVLAGRSSSGDPRQE